MQLKSDEQFIELLPDKTREMEIWSNMNKINTFKNDFFWSSNSEEIWATDLVTGPISRYAKRLPYYLRINLTIPTDFKY